VPLGEAQIKIKEIIAAIAQALANALSAKETPSSSVTTPSTTHNTQSLTKVLKIVNPADGKHTGEVKHYLRTTYSGFKILFLMSFRRRKLLSRFLVSVKLAISKNIPFMNSNDGARYITGAIPTLPLDIC
jgi:hypothetical protein